MPGWQGYGKDVGLSGSGVGFRLAGDRCIGGSNGWGEAFSECGDVQGEETIQFAFYSADGQCDPAGEALGLHRDLDVLGWGDFKGEVSKVCPAGPAVVAYGQGSVVAVGEGRQIGVPSGDG